MALTRKELKAANTQLAAQLASTTHETRKALMTQLANKTEQLRAAQLQVQQLETENSRLKAFIAAQSQPA